MSSPALPSGTRGTRNSLECREGSSPLEHAVALVAQRGYTYARAKEATGVPTGTIHRAVKAKEQHRKAGRNGRPPKINEEETAALIDEMRQANAIGLPFDGPALQSKVGDPLLYRTGISDSEKVNELIRARLRAFGEELDEEELNKRLVSSSWPWKFQKAHEEEILLSTPRTTDSERIAVQPSHIDEWFDMYEHLRETKEYPLALIANVDETMLQTYKRRHKVFTPRDCPIRGSSRTNE